MEVTELPELVRHENALVHSLWGHEIPCHLDTTVEISDLMWRTGRDEYSIALVLENTEHFNAVFGVQNIQHTRVDVADLVMNGVCIVFGLLLFTILSIILLFGECYLVIIWFNDWL